MSFLRVFLRLPPILALVACSSSPSTFSQKGTTAAAVPTPAQAIDVANATAADCANGGKIYSIYLDLNGSGVLDPEDQVISRQAVCNGNNGLSTLLAMTRVTIDTATCAAGAGLQISSGLDQNASGGLEPSEFQNTQLLCDGRNGEIGSSGPAGHDGASFQMLSVPALTADCPAGGATLLMALDINHNGFYSADDPEQQALTLCNGENAPPTAYSPVAAIRPCGDNVPFKEVLLRLANGQVLGSFSNDVSGNMTRLAFLPDGNFMDTDGSSCTFSLSTSADHFNRSISWGGSVQETWLLH